MEYIRNTYNVPAKRGMNVLYKDVKDKYHHGVIVGSRGSYLRIKCETLYCGNTRNFHPTHNLIYNEI